MCPFEVRQQLGICCANFGKVKLSLEEFDFSNQPFPRPTEIVTPALAH